MKEINKLGKQFKTFETKELNWNGESRTISGYAAIFGNIDKANDMLIKGCFAKSIQDRGPESSANDKIIMLWQHDRKEPIGRISVLREDEKGLYFECVIDDVERGNQTLKQLESGTLNQFSIGYSYVWENCEYDREHDILIVKEVVLFEISVVTIGCNAETEYLGLKAEGNQYEALKKEIDNVCKGLSITKKEEVQTVVRKALSLVNLKPEVSTNPLEKKQADDKVKLFGNLKLKELC